MFKKKFIDFQYYAQNQIYDKIVKIYFDEKYENVFKCVKNFELIKRNLTNRINDEIFKSTRRVFNQRFIDAQKQIFFDYIRRLNDQNISFDFTLVKNVVNYILHKSDNFVFFLDHN